MEEGWMKTEYCRRNNKSVIAMSEATRQSQSREPDKLGLFQRHRRMHSPGPGGGAKDIGGIKYVESRRRSTHTSA